ncbi:MAG: biopolymer transporter ExbD [Pseudomonadota bacterium]|nr:biopolymer transporter ExbD [Pseudomonadota bacterium]
MSATQRRQTRQRQKQRQVVQLSLTSLMDIFTILVFFLLVSAQNPVQMPALKDLTLPKSTTSDGAERSLVLTVSQSQIMLNDQLVMDFDPSAAAQDFTALAGALNAQRDQYEASQVINQTEQRQIIIMADQQLPYALLKQIMQVCSQQRFGQVSFAVLREAGNV